jgi:glucosamine-6-phosphate deaminase
MDEHPPAAPPAPIVVAAPEEACGRVAEEIHALLAEGARAGRPVTLGLATGGTMVGVYAALVARLGAEPVGLSRVTTFNLDEYLGLPAEHPLSFRSFMTEHLFGPAGFAPERCHFPDAELAAQQPGLAGEAYQALIARHGGIDLQLLGIGRNGHVAFNEPGTPSAAVTRVVPLHEHTREDAAAAFGGLEQVPTHAITMGLLELRAARRLRLLAFGAGKAAAVRAMLSGPASAACPASLLRDHADLQVLTDGAAASALDA